MSGDHGLGNVAVLFADHVEARQMGEHVREFRFPEPVLLHSVRILARGQRPTPSSSFEGKTFPDVRTMSLSVYAADRLSSSSTMPKLRAGDVPGSFVAPSDRFVSQAVVVRGEYLRLSVAVYGQLLPSGEVLPEPGHELANVAPHLRPLAPFEADRLDLADFEGSISSSGVDGPLPDGGVDVSALADAAAAPSSLARALALGTLPESSSRLADHADWIASLPDEQDVLEAEAIVSRLETLVRDVGKLAQQAPDANAAHVSYGPVLARNLVALTSRCMERLEFRPLRAALRALAASLCAAPTAAEVLKRGGVPQLVAVLRDNEWAQTSIKIAALQALLQLCSHAVGMEALLGWSRKEDAVLPPTETGYEVVLSLVLEDVPGHSKLEEAALTLLKRAGFYQSLAKLDSLCAKLGVTEEPGGASGEATGEEAFRNVVEALSSVAAQFEELSAARDGPSRADADSMLAEECPRAFSEGEYLPGSSTASSGDPFATAAPQLHGFLESFAAGRRLLPALCQLLRRLPKFAPQDRLAAFAPLRRLVCALLACVGGAQFLASDPQALTSFLALLDPSSHGGRGAKSAPREVVGLPPVPRLPERLIRCAIGAPELAALVNMHVRATRLVLLLVARTRQHGRNGLLAEQDALPLLAALHQLCARGAAGRDSVVCAFRSVFLVEWLLRQLEGRLEEATPAAGSLAQARPSLRHLVAIVHSLLLADPAASVAERFGARVHALTSRALELLEGGADAADPAEGAVAGSWARPHGASLEFALDSEGPDGGLGRAVLAGRRSADNACLSQLREMLAQLRPWQQADGDQAAAAPQPGAAADAPVLTARLLACLRLAGPPQALKRSTNEERGSRLSLSLGGYCGAGPAGVETPEVDFAPSSGAADGAAGGGAAAADAPDADVRERFPPCDPSQLPLLAMRLLCRRAAGGARDALAIVLHEEADGQEKRASPSAPPASRDGIAVLVPILIRCAAALNLNLDTLTLRLREESEPIDAIYATQYAHAQLLEAALQACFHLLRGLRQAGLSQYRHTELLHTLLLLSDRLTSGLVGMTPRLTGADPEFRLLWRHCLVWTCRVFRTWAQSFPGAMGGQLLQPLLRHARVLPWHFAPGLLLLATCGSLGPLLPAAPHNFAVQPGKGGPEAAAAAGEQVLQSQPLLVPASTRGGACSHILLKTQADGKAAPEGGKVWGQLWGSDCEAIDWEAPAEASHPSNGMRDSLVRMLGNKPHTVGVAMALSLVGRVNARRERLSIDDIGELSALVAECSMTSDALLHLVTARVLEKLNSVGIPVLGLVLRLGEAALNGTAAAAAAAAAAPADAEPGAGADGAVDGAAAPAVVGGATRDPRDGRAVSRILMLLARFGERTPKARAALADSRAETLCLSVLAHSPASLPPMAVTQAIRVLSLMFCPGLDAGRAQDRSAGPRAPPPSVPKCRMVSKALSLMLNRSPEDGQLAGPAALAAALELLLKLNSVRSMCLNLLFSALEEVAVEGAPVGHPIPVAVSCAFRLASCADRLARELGTTDERWDATPRQSEGEAAAEEALSAWLHVGELLVNLCQTVLQICPTASVFLAVVLPAGQPAESFDEAALKGVLGDLDAVLTRITTRRQRAETVPMRAAELLGKLRALNLQLVGSQLGPPPTTLSREDLCPPWHTAAAAAASAGEGEPSGEGGGTAGSAGAAAADGEEDDVLEEIVRLFDAASEVEGDAEWHSVAELDAADQVTDGPRVEWEFDAAVHRKRRQAALEKAEADRRAKRLKLAQQRVERPDERAQARRRAPDPEPPSRAEKAARRSGGGAAGPPAGSPPAAAAVPPERPPPAAAAPAAQAAAAPTAASSPQPGPRSASPSARPTEAAAAVPGEAGAGAKAAAGPNPAEALQSFLKDHPEFMRVLQNPKKCLSDPRVKSMFVSELQNYPAVKSFLATKGLVLT